MAVANPTCEPQATQPLSYAEFLAAKIAIAPDTGIAITDDEIHPLLKPHQRAMVQWAVQGGRRALFASFGLGKSLCQLEICRLILKYKSGAALIVCPLGVRGEFLRDASMIETPIRFIRTTAEIESTGIHLTNYESVREGKLDPSAFTVISLDEGNVLRGTGGVKTFRVLMGLFEGRSTYRYVASATPDPNSYEELLSYAAFLGIMDISMGKTLFFKRDSVHTDRLTLHKTREVQFWTWVASWSCFLNLPSDICSCCAEVSHAS